MGDMTDEEILALKEDLLEANERLAGLMAEDNDDEPTEDSDPKIWESTGGRQVIYWVLGAILLGVLAFTGGLNAEAITTILAP